MQFLLLFFCESESGRHCIHNLSISRFLDHKCIHVDRYAVRMYTCAQNNRWIHVYTHMLMVDWLTLEVPFSHHPIDSGRIEKIGATGELEWTTNCGQSVEGSFDSSLYVRSIGSDSERCLETGAVIQKCSHLRIDGNPSKFLQGHNIFGSDSVIDLARSVLTAVCGALNLPYNFDMLKRVGQSKVTRIDITSSFALRDRPDVLAWLRAAELKARTRSGRPQSKGSTVYFQKNSRRWSLKFYSKGQELEAGKKHQLSNQIPCDLQNHLKQFANNLLRCELTLRSMELKDLNLNTVDKLTPEKLAWCFKEYLGRVEMNKQVLLPDDKAMELPRCVVSTYELWKQCADLRQLLPRNTYYRHRKQLLNFDIDIANPPPEDLKSSNVVPLIRVLEAEPVVIPDWAYKTYRGKDRVISLVHR